MPKVKRDPNLSNKTGHNSRQRENNNALKAKIERMNERRKIREVKKRNSEPPPSKGQPPPPAPTAKRAAIPIALPRPNTVSLVVEIPAKPRLPSPPPATTSNSLPFNNNSL